MMTEIKMGKMWYCSTETRSVLLYGSTIILENIKCNLKKYFQILRYIKITINILFLILQYELLMRTNNK